LSGSEHELWLRALAAAEGWLASTGPTNGHVAADVFAKAILEMEKTLSAIRKSEIDGPNVVIGSLVSRIKDLEAWLREVIAVARDQGCLHPHEADRIDEIEQWLSP
jgi:hypothetical protein